ncbi:hypothetical protein H5410_009872 [Solanum commersonii]|uniref:Uncharacterized protein n=1 Tax=Solanum commersonii TaxID=4109 RepID=A0A9J6AJ58_SOLCO|nr:hypothetical protein H5410_009872 [Solanum commersonii]
MLSGSVTPLHMLQILKTLDVPKVAICRNLQFRWSLGAGKVSGTEDPYSSAKLISFVPGSSSPLFECN